MLAGYNCDIVLSGHRLVAAKRSNWREGRCANVPNAIRLDVLMAEKDILEVTRNVVADGVLDEQGVETILAAARERSEKQPLTDKIFMRSVVTSFVAIIACIVAPVLTRSHELTEMMEKL